MERRIRILILEHDPIDIDLLQFELKKGLPDSIHHVVKNEKEFETALKICKADIILSDYSMPGFDGVRAFEMKQQTIPHIPFIIVSGTIGEENAVELIKRGLTDYVLKDKLFSLVPKIIRALNEADEKKRKREAEEALQKSEANLRAMFDSTGVGFLFLNTDYTVMAFNQTSLHWATHSFGVELKENINFKALLPPDRVSGFTLVVDRVISGKEIIYETNCPKTDGTLMWYQVHAKPVTGTGGKIMGICLAISDTTDRKAAEEEIKKLNTGLEERVKERTTHLVEANTALEAFSYSVSHDLRSPLRSVMGFTQLISKEHAHTFTGDLKDLFSHIEKSSARMNAIIEDLLSLAKYGKEKLHLGDVDMNALFNGVWDNLLFNAPHTACIDMQNLPVVTADGSMLEQVIVNLVSNAVKYSSKKEKPQITVGCTEQEKEFVFYVKDNGAGFDMKNYDKLFGVFKRLHTLQEFDGTGVGLCLVKRIIEKHGGSVWAEGKVDEGATFYFSLPKSKGYANIFKQMVGMEA